MAQIQGGKIPTIKLNEVWTLFYLPPGMKNILNRWVFQAKQIFPWTYRARTSEVVAKYVSQKPGIDFGNIYEIIYNMTLRDLLNFDGQNWLEIL